MKLTSHKEPLAIKSNVTAGDAGVAVETKVLVKSAKVRLPVKLCAFTLTVITLSWFFEGWRELQQAPGLIACAYLFFGTSFTLLLLALQGYWIYVEEKSTGKLVRKVKLFDKIEAKLSAKTDQGKRNS